MEHSTSRSKRCHSPPSLHTPHYPSLRTTLHSTPPFTPHHPSPTPPFTPHHPSLYTTLHPHHPSLHTTLHSTLFAPQHSSTTRPSSSMEFLEGPNPSVIRNRPKKTLGRKSDVDDYIPPKWLIDSCNGRKRDPNAPVKIPKLISEYKSYSKPPPPLDFSLSKKLLEELAQISTQDLAKFVQKNCGRAVRLTDGFNLILGEGTYQKPLERKRLDQNISIACGVVDLGRQVRGSAQEKRMAIWEVFGSRYL
ncbi:hypothetical protein BC936DRAFT_144252 [Jimgerdemannia flammicorona]|uniref:Uncharacterized protein n=1 Tax=Jimgerdemannia flammicorona TaxID=994334 RepID=A0A433DCR6_9FUNG|nr:hypothetical protein BC936DRAFT_144252 [Jimgerdemannia flammicorona]